MGSLIGFRRLESIYDHAEFKRPCHVTNSNFLNGSVGNRTISTAFAYGNSGSSVALDFARNLFSIMCAPIRAPVYWTFVGHGRRVIQKATDFAGAP